MVTKQKVPNTPLPDPGQHDGAAHVQMSKRFQEHITIEVKQGQPAPGIRKGMGLGVPCGEGCGGTTGMETQRARFH